MTSNTKKVVTAILLLIIALSLSIFLFLGDETKNRFTECNSIFIFKNNHAGLELPVNATLILRPDSTALIELTGFATIDRKPYKLARAISFGYEKEQNNMYKLTHIKQDVHAGDNVNSDFLNSNFFSISKEQNRYMTLSRLGNAFIAGNLHSPVFMCVIKPQ